MQAKNVLNSVCFIRKYRFNNTEDAIRESFENLKKQTAMHRKYGFRVTYMPEYDALIDSDYLTELRKEEKAGAEIGFWFEVVKPLVEECGMVWRGRKGHPWDHYVNPGFLMAYTENEKSILIDTAMNKFRELFGYYPKAVGSWLLDSFSMQYMSESYPVDAFIICREQWGMDGYTLWGGPYYGGYYPSKNNMQTPAVSEENRIKIPVFRMFINDPIYCYYEHEHADGRFQKFNRHPGGLFTQEPAWSCGQNPEWIGWQYDNLFASSNAGISFIQLGQENGFGWENRVEIGLPLQYEHILSHPEYDLQSMTVSELGRYFKETFKDTPPMAMGALTDWCGLGHQSVWYNSKFYRVNLWNDGENVLIRDMHAFFDNYRDPYLDTPCTTHNASYDNPPIVDGVRMTDDDGEVKAGLYFGKGGILSRRDCDEYYEVVIETEDNRFTVKLYPERIVIEASAPFALELRKKEEDGFITEVCENKIRYCCRNVSYALNVDGKINSGRIESCGNILTLSVSEE